MREQILKNLKDELCNDEDCEFTADLPNCVDDEISNEISNQTFYNIVKREAGQKNKQRTKNLVKINLYVKISKKLGMWKQNGTRSDNIKQVKEELKSLSTNERLKKRLKNLDIDLSYLKLDEKIKCKSGSVSKNYVCGKNASLSVQTVIFQIKISVQCARGTYHDKTINTCTSCPFGSFQNVTGQESCIQCPENFSTRKTNSKFEVDCRQKCPPGTVARIKVPKNKKTNETLIKSLMPFCKACDLGEYQPFYDQTECLKCPEGFTSSRGARTLADCFQRIEQPCALLPCGKNGECIADNNFYHCDCDEGFIGGT